MASCKVVEHVEDVEGGEKALEERRTEQLSCVSAGSRELRAKGRGKEHLEIDGLLNVPLVPGR